MCNLYPLLSDEVVAAIERASKERGCVKEICIVAARQASPVSHHRSVKSR